MFNMSEEKVHKLVEELKEKLGIKEPIENIIDIYQAREYRHEVLKMANNSQEIPECAKKHYYPWIDVIASMYTMPDKVSKKLMFCPKCGARLVGLYFSSPTWTWRTLCGRAGNMTICPECPRQVKFNLTMMN